MRLAAGGRLRRQHAVRRAFTRLLLGFLQREFGPDSFRVERVTAPRCRGGLRDLVEQAGRQRCDDLGY